MSSKNIYDDLETEQNQLIEDLGKMLKILKQRQENYFKLIDFVKKNIDGIQNQMEEVNTIDLAIKQLQNRQQQLRCSEQVFINQYKEKIIKQKNKLILRLPAKIFQIIEPSINTIRNTYFITQNILKSWRKFRKNFIFKITSEEINLGEIIEYTLSYSKNKFFYELKRISQFKDRLEAGEYLSLKQFYNQNYQQKQILESKNQDQNTRQIKKKKSLKQKKSKQKSRQKYKQKRQYISPKKNSQTAKNTSTNFINKLMKLYSVVDPSKIQFVEDYLFSNQSQKQQSKIINSLIEKNKQIAIQTKQYYEKIKSIEECIKTHKIQSDSQKSVEKVNPPELIKKQSSNTNNFFDTSKQNLEKINTHKKKKQKLKQIIVINSQGENLSDKQGNNGNSQKKILKSASSKRPISKNLLKAKVFPNLSKNFKENTYKIEEQKMKEACKKYKNNRIFLINDKQKISKENKDSKIYNSKKSRLQSLQKQKNKKNNSLHKTSNNPSRMSLRKEEKIHSNENQIQFINIMTDSGNHEEQIQSTSKEKEKRGTIQKKQFNLRLKKQAKKSILISEKLFIQQCNEQMNHLIFPVQ